MKSIFAFFLAFFALGLQAQTALPKYNPDDIDIPYKKFTLPNGLRLVVHEDHKAPIVAVNIWYHVGSKNEVPGKSGFAHLFEHLMFNGSENYNKDYFQVLESIGSTDLNGTTNEDRTNYFQNVPVNALDQVLFLESDRMGHLLGAIDQAKLDEQRGVVQNEKRQGENNPYALEWDLLQKNMYPPHHPYGHTVIGEMADLNAASLDDVHTWFKSYYGTANAVMVVAGDITPEVAYQKVLKYFGNIPAGPVISRPGVNIPKYYGERRLHYQDRVPEAKVSATWATTQWGTEESAYLDLLSDILGSGKTSRLNKRLVYDKQIASRVEAFANNSEISGEFYISARVKPTSNLAEVEKAMNEVLTEFLATGPTEEEMSRVKASYFANFIKGLERIGGFGGKSDLLASNETYGGSPDYYKKQLKIYDKATAANILAVAKKYLSDGRLVVVCEPYPEYQVSGNEADRSKLPDLEAPATVSFPDVQKATLSNGMKVVLAQRKGSPSIVMNTMFDAGFCSDHWSKKPGLASLAMDMLDEGTRNMNSLAINERLQLLGASLNTYSDLDYSYINMSMLKQSLDQSLDLYADVMLRPAFPDEDLKRTRTQQLSKIKNEKKQPTSALMRIMPKLLYGENHPYSMPMTGTGDEASVTALSVGDARTFHETYIRPNNATLVVSGDISMTELVAKLESRLQGWQKGTIPTKVIPQVAPDAMKNTVFLLDRPASVQSMIMASYLIDGYGKYDEDALEQMNNVLGGDFTSRINMNIREDKHWSYGSRAMIMNTQSQRPFLVFAPVQTDKTMESAKEVIKEMTDFTSTKPMTQAEFDKTKQNTVLGMAGMWETNSRVNGSLQDLVKYNLPDNYWAKYDSKVRNLQLPDVHKLANKVVSPSGLTWFVAGDKSKVLEPLMKMNMKIIEIDADGKVVEKDGKP